VADDDMTAGVRVPLIAEDEATGRTAEVYEEIKAATGFPFVPDMFRLASTKPELMEAIIAGYKGTFLTEGALSRDTKEMIAAWTSHVCQCPYCVGTHNFFLQAFGGSEELAHAIEGAESADDLPVDDSTKTLMHLMTKVTETPYKITDEDWENTLAAGWSSEALLEAVFIASLFNFITRLVDSLGLGASMAQSRISQQQQDEYDSDSDAA
jgi:uncharacterized peroxidase-related enzyme